MAQKLRPRQKTKPHKHKKSQKALSGEIALPLDIGGDGGEPIGAPEEI